MRIFLAWALFFAFNVAADQKYVQKAGDEPTVQKLCTLDKLTYSPGAIVKKGNKYIKCSPEGKWKRTTKADGLTK
jgi:Protein of unknown function (DUF1496)